jgi:hypothetical protein
LGVTDPSASWPNIGGQIGTSLLAGSPYTAYNPAAGPLGNIGGALGQRLATTLYPGGQSNQDIQAAIQRLLQQQGMNARALPVTGSLPGNQFSW